ncbi:MAG: porin [Candidatus Binatia bacterium]
MQKKLLTLAVAGALAAPGAALAQVEVYGFVFMSANKFKYSTPTQAGAGTGFGSVSKWDVASHASNYGVRGRENLGGGQTAWFQIEQNAPMERSNNVAITPASRNSAVGMQGGWGNIFIGQWTTPWADLDALWGVGTVGGWGPITSIIGRRETTGAAPNFNCANGVSPGPGICDAVESAGGVGHAFWRRVSQAIFYQSPVFGGVQLKFAYQTNEGKATAGTGVLAADPSLWSASAAWSGMGGRLRVGAALDSHKDFSTIGQSDSGFRVTGGWNFGFADVGLAYESMTYKTTTGDCDATQWGVGVAIPVGSGAIRASYAVADDIDGTFVAGPVPGAGAGAPTACGGITGFTAAQAANNGAKTYNIGYDHRFSKRTTVGIGYAVIKNDEGAVFTWTGAPPTQTGGAVTAANVPFPGSDPSTFFVSIIHRF